MSFVALYIVFTLWTPHLSLAETYYATPTLDTSCPIEGAPCTTLSSYATKPVSYFSANTTLILLPGNHTLDQRFVLKGLSSVYMTVYVNESSSSLDISHAIVLCSEQATFSIEHMDVVHIKGLTSIGCRRNTLLYIERVTLEDFTTVGNGNEGGIYISNAINVTIAGASFLNNTGVVPSSSHDPIVGGALVSVENKYIDITNSIFNSNSVGEQSSHFAVAHGGALYVYQSHMKLHSTSFIHNTAQGAGGAVIALNSNVDFSNCSLSYNKAYQGGVISTDVLTRITINRSNFSQNEAYYEGGVIDISFGISGGAINTDGALQIVNSTFNNNSAPVAGVISAFNTTLTITNSQFRYNNANTGGVIVALNSTSVAIHFSTFINNTAAQFYGVVGAKYNSEVAIYHSIFHYNTARLEAGVLKAAYNTSVAIHNSCFEFNTVMNRGGVLFTEQNSTVTLNSSKFYNNKADVAGGVVYAQSNGTVSFHNSTFENNRAMYYGGVIMAIQAVTVTVYNSFFHYNTATDTLGCGGVLAASWNTNTFMYGCEFKYNTAKLAGGVITIANGTMTTIYGSTFQYNQALTGGCIGTRHNPNLPADLNDENGIHIISSTFDHNRALGGGVLFVSNYGSITIENTQMEYNSANKTGGVIECVGPLSTIEIYHSDFNNNVAYDAGVILAKDSATTVAIYKSSFQHNTATHYAGVITVNSDIARINSCTFYHNKAIDGGVIHIDYQSSSIVIQNTRMEYNRADNYGGAVVCSGTLGEKHTKVLFENLTLSHNRATGFGAAIYLLKCNLTSNGFLEMYDNVNVRSAGVLYMLQSTAVFFGETNISSNVGSVFAVESAVTFFGTTVFEDCSSGRKIGINSVNFQEAGAITLFNSALYLRGNATLTNNQADNGGAIIAIDSNIKKSGNTVIANNTAVNSGGGIYAHQSDISFSGNSTIAHNRAATSGGGIHAVASTVRFSNGTHRFVNNIATEKGVGGALFLELSSKIQILKIISEENNCSTDKTHHEFCTSNSTLWLNLNFIDNCADFGGAIFVKDSTNSESCRRISSNTYLPINECFFQPLREYYSVSAPSYAPIKSTLFINNTANTAGNDLYGGLLDRCTFNPFVEQYTSVSDYAPVNYLQDVTNIKLNSISSPPVRICFCDQNGKPNCSLQSPSIKVIKGQTFTFSAVVVDHVNHTLPFSSITCLLSSQNGGLAEGQTIQNTFESCTDLTYTVFSPSLSEKLICYANEGPCNELGISKQLLEVHFEPCPTGFKLTPSNSSCDCDPYLKPMYISNCSISTGSLLRKGDYWITLANFNSTEDSGYVIYSHCPFDYCHPSTEQVSFDLNSRSGVDRQCSFNRSGVLCGQCENGLSVSLGSTRCTPCSNYWLLLFIPFALAGIVLVAFILSINLTVAVGTISGIVFYANIVAVNHDIYLPFEKPNFLTVFISWLNLDFGFETCFYNGMDAYAKTWLQFVFPLYIIFLVVAIIEISDYSPRFASLFTGKNPVATLATLILLSYAKLLRTIIAAMSFARLDYPDGSREMVWLLDANVPYLQGKHILLFIAAVVIALVGLLYTLVLFSWQLLLRCPRNIIFLKWMTNSKLLAFIDAYHAPYNKEHRYWTGMLFLLRTLLYLVSAVNVLGDPRVNLASINCTLLFLFMHATLVQRPLKTVWLNCLECAHLFNLSIFTTLTFYLLDSSGNQATLAYTSASIAAVLYGAVVVYHTYSFALKKRIKYTLVTFYAQLVRTAKPSIAELPNVAADHDTPDKVSVTEVNAQPNIHSTMEDATDSDSGEENWPMDHESDTPSDTDCDERAPLLNAV